MKNVDELRTKYEAIAPLLNERSRRRWAALEARAYGYGGISAVAHATGLSRNTVMAGLRELQGTGDEPIPLERVRHQGAGRRRLAVTDEQLQPLLEKLVDPVTRGDPQHPLRWTSKSTPHLAAELTKQGHSVSAGTVATMLKAMGFSLQSPRKVREGGSHKDRDKQFRHINRQTQLFQRKWQPVISVDTKKKELVGTFKNGGREWQIHGKPEEVNVYDFPRLAAGKAIPYGVYDVTLNAGWVSVGVDHDTPQFAVNAIREWWKHMGSKEYPVATDLLVVSDSGGSNSARSRVWKIELQRLADDLRMRIHVSHMPPGTSKWNKIEHRLFCHITQNWRGRPLVSYETVVSLISHTTTRTGLKVKATLDRHLYQTGIKVADTEMKELQIKRSRFHGEWNYTFTPRSTCSSNF